MSWRLLLLLCLCAALAALLTAVVRRYALGAGWLDLPGARSSHARPTPRGGGLAIVISFGLGLLALAGWGLVDWPTLLALGGGGALVAGIGLLDDRFDLPVRWRLLVHLLAAAWVVAWLGFPPLPLPGAVVDLGWLGLGLGVLLLVWLLNLYNFMDGIDGIAAVEAVTVAVGAALLLASADGFAAAAPVALLGAGAAGFLVWNWPPAKIFMGDVGSAFLGFVFGALALATSGAGLLNLYSWMILLAMFIADATVTLLRRVLRGERWHEAHRSHAYQRAARRFGGHLKVTVAFGLVNLAWLLPLAWLAQRHPQHGVWLLGLAYLPLVTVALMSGAGLPDEPATAGSYAEPAAGRANE